MSQLPHYSVTSALLMTTFRIPMILQQTVPFIALFAGMAALISLNRRYELVIARAASISVWQFLQRFVIGAFLFGILAVIVLNPIAAWGTKQAEALEAKWEARLPPSRRSRSPASPDLWKKTIRSSAPGPFRTRAGRWSTSR